MCTVHADFLDSLEVRKYILLLFNVYSARRVPGLFRGERVKYILYNVRGVPGERVHTVLDSTQGVPGLLRGERVNTVQCNTRSSWTH